MINCTFENGNKASLRHVVVHILVEKDGKILLVKRGEGLLEAGKWALPGGFLDRDENVEGGALRELKEETGWDGEIISLFKINTNPNRPKEDRQNIAFDFLAKATVETGKPDSESSKVEWMNISNISLEDMAFDHADTIKLYLEYKNKEFSLPKVF